MPFSATPPEGLVTLSQNARTVLDKRYLVKDKSGKSVALLIQRDGQKIFVPVRLG